MAFGPNVYMNNGQIEISTESKERIRNKFSQLFVNPKLSEIGKIRIFAEYLKNNEKMMRAGNVILNGANSQFYTDFKQMVNTNESDLRKIKNSGNTTATVLTSIFSYIRENTDLQQIINAEKQMNRDLPKQIELMNKRIKRAKQLLRKNNIRDTSGAALAEILRQLSTSDLS